MGSERTAAAKTILASIFVRQVPHRENRRPECRMISATWENCCSSAANEGDAWCRAQSEFRPVPRVEPASRHLTSLEIDALSDQHANGRPKSPNKVLAVAYKHYSHGERQPECNRDETASIIQLLFCLSVLVDKSFAQLFAHTILGKWNATLHVALIAKLPNQIKLYQQL